MEYWATWFANPWNSIATLAAIVISVWVAQYELRLRRWNELKFMDSMDENKWEMVRAEAHLKHGFVTAQGAVAVKQVDE